MKLFIVKKQNMFNKFLAVIICVAAVFVFSAGTSYGATAAAKTSSKTITVKATFVNNVTPGDSSRVLVRLYKDGRKTSRVAVLTSANGWTAKFTRLSKNHKWRVKTAGELKGFKLVTKSGVKTVTIQYSKLYYGSSTDYAVNID